MQLKSPNLQTVMDTLCSHQLAHCRL